MVAGIAPRVIFAVSHLVAIATAISSLAKAILYAAIPAPLWNTGDFFVNFSGVFIGESAGIAEDYE